MSSVLTDSFFLSPAGRFDPGMELEAVLMAYFEPGDACGDMQAQCRFPARYFWLSHQLELPDYQLRLPSCHKLENWALLDKVQSVSMLLVSGYLGNPASTFGHALIKLNTDSIDDQTGLFDLTLNFGALVPENENPLFYVIRGLTGSYEAGFSDRYFYTQDLVYSRTEFRDMWDYRLNLTEYQKNLLIFHIWEIAGKKFKYYFLTKNCAYRLAELLELVMDEDLLDTAGHWFIPVELFHNLQEIDRVWKSEGQPGLIQSMQFVPSSRRVLYNELKNVNEEDIVVINRIIEGGFRNAQDLMEGFSEDRRIIILDGLLAYQQYRLIADQPDSASFVRQEKDRILLARLKLPGRSYTAPDICALPAPAEGFKPMALGFEAVHGDREREFGRLSWSPFKKESVGQNSLEGNELVLLDLAVGLSKGRPGFFLDGLDLIRVLSLNTLNSRISGDNRTSWKLQAGIHRLTGDLDTGYDGRVGFGIGRAWKGSRTFSVFGLASVEAHTEGPLVRIAPEIGLIASFGLIRARVNLELVSKDYEGTFDERFEAKVLFRLNECYSIHLVHNVEGIGESKLGLTRYY